MSTVKRAIPVFANDMTNDLENYVKIPEDPQTESISSAVAAILEFKTDPVSVLVDFETGEVQVLESDPVDVALAFDLAVNHATLLAGEIFGVPADSGKSIEFTTVMRDVQVVENATGIVGISDQVDPNLQNLTVSGLLDRLERAEVCKQALVCQAGLPAVHAAAAPAGFVFASTLSAAHADSLKTRISNQTMEMFSGNKITISRAENGTPSAPGSVFE